MHATFTIELANHTKSDGTKAGYLRVTIQKKHQRIPLNLSIKEEHFVNGRVKKADPGALTKNIRIDQAISKANKIRDDYYIMGKNMTMEDFLTEYGYKNYGSQSFYDYADREVPLMAATRTAGSMKCYTTMINNLKKFRPRLNLTDINYDFLRNYERFCITGNLNGQQNAHKNIKYLKCMMSRALMSGFIKDTSYQHFKIKMFEGNRDFLTPDELKTLNDLYWSGSLSLTHSRVLRYFLFSCYTGLRYTDLLDLRFKDIYETMDEEGNVERTIRIKQHKTQGLVTIPLVIADGLRLLPERGFDEQKVYDIKVGQYGNRILQQIMPIAKINKHISMHCARHTFATVALIKGIRIDFVSKFLGHKNLKVTAIYAKYVDPTLIKEMRKWDARPQV